MVKSNSSLTAKHAIGISIECDALRLAEGHAGRVKRCAAYPYPPGLTVEDDAFADFVKNSLSAFCPAFRHLPVWVSSGFSTLQARYLSLPGVSSRSVSDMVYWAFRKDLPFPVQETLFDYDVEMQAVSTRDAKMYVMAYTVPCREVEALTALLARAQIHPAGVIVPHAAIRNLVRMDGVMGEGASLCVYVGEDATTLLVVKDGLVLNCRVFKTGMNALLGVVSDQMPDLPPAEAFKRIDAALAAIEPDEKDIRIREVPGRILQQIELSLAVYSNEHKQESVDKMYIMGAIAGVEPFAALLQQRLGVELDHVVLPDVTFVDMPDTESDQAAVTISDQMALAAGAAISHRDRTPNLLFTCQERERQTRRSRWSTLSLLVAALAVALLHLAYGVCEQLNLRLKGRLESEQQRLAAFSPLVDQTMLATMTQTTLSEGIALKRLAVHWLPYAVFYPLGEQRLPEILVKEITFTAPAALDTDNNNPKKRGVSRGRDDSGMLKLRGVVGGDPSSQRSKLASFAMRLEDSALITQARTLKISQGAMDEPAASLSFEIEADLVTHTSQVDNVSVKEVTL